MEDEGIEVDMLAVGCTRLATIIGIPLSAFMVELVVVMEVFIFSRNLLALLSIVPVHILQYLVCMKEPRIYDLLLLWLLTKGRAFVGNWRFWRVNSYSPLAIDVNKSVRKIKGKMK